MPPSMRATTLLLAIAATLHAAVAVMAEAPHGQTAPPIRVVLVGDSTVTDDSGWGAGFKRHVQVSSPSSISVESRPRDHLDMSRSGGRQRVPYAGEVWLSDMDAHQHGASCDRSLQRFGAFV